MGSYNGSDRTGCLPDSITKETDARKSQSSLKKVQKSGPRVARTPFFSFFHFTVLALLLSFIMLAWELLSNRKKVVLAMLGTSYS